MFRVFPPARVQRRLEGQGGSFTTRLGLFDSAWNPADDIAPIRGPADRVTYRLLPDRRVEIEVERGQRRMAVGPPHERGKSRDPLPEQRESARRQQRSALLLAAMFAGMMLLLAVGFLVGFRASHGRASAGFMGAGLAVVVGYMIQLAAQVGLGIRGNATHAGASDRQQSSGTESGNLE